MTEATGFLGLFVMIGFAFFGIVCVTVCMWLIIKLFKQIKL